MSQPKSFLYRCFIPVSRQGGKSVQSKRYCYVDELGFIQLAYYPEQVPVYAEGSPEYLILEQYRTGPNYLGITRRKSERQGTHSLSGVNKALNGSLGHVAMAQAQIDRLAVVDANYGIGLDPSILAAITAHLEQLKQAIAGKREELGFKTKQRS